MGKRTVLTAVEELEESSETAARLTFLSYPDVYAYNTLYRDVYELVLMNLLFINRIIIRTSR